MSKMLAIFRIVVIAAICIMLEMLASVVFTLFLAVMIPLILIWSIFGCIFFIPWQFIYALWLYAMELDKSKWRDLLFTLKFFFPIDILLKTDEGEYLDIMRFMKNAWTSSVNSISKIYKSIN